MPPVPGTERVLGESEIHEGEPIPMAGASWDHTGRYEYIEMPVVHAYHAKFDMPSWQYGYFFSSSREINSVLGKPEEEESSSQGVSSGPELLEIVDKTYLEVANFKYSDLLKQYNGQFFADHNLVVIFNLQASSSTSVIPFCKRLEGGNYLFGTRTVFSGGQGIAQFAPHAFFFELPKEVDSSRVKIQFTEEHHYYE